MQLKTMKEKSRTSLEALKTALDNANIEFAIINNGGSKLGNCYYQSDLLVYSRSNVDDTRYDDVYAEESKSFNRRKKLLDFLPKANAGCELGKFEAVEGIPGLFVAKYYYRTDSSD